MWLTDERNSLERVMHLFLCLEKETEILIRIFDSLLNEND